MVCKQTLSLELIQDVNTLLSTTILDPCCGSGVFVVSCYEYLASKMIALLSQVETDRQQYADFYYISDGHMLLTIAGRRAIATRCIYAIDCDEAAIEVAIFPYSRNGSTFSIIEETTFMSRYPLAYSLLREYKPELDARDKGHGHYPAWYAYGRTQGMNNFGKKLLIPYISDTPTAVLSTNENLLFYCGYALFSDSEDELRILKAFLESDAFWFYIFHTSKPYAKGFMAFAKNYIVNFCIPYLSDFEIQYILSDPPHKELNAFIWKKYDIEVSTLSKY